MSEQEGFYCQKCGTQITGEGKDVHQRRVHQEKAKIFFKDGSELTVMRRKPKSVSL